MTDQHPLLAGGRLEEHRQSRCKEADPVECHQRRRNVLAQAGQLRRWIIGPESPVAWLIHVAKVATIDMQRRAVAPPLSGRCRFLTANVDAEPVRIRIDGGIPPWNTTPIR